MCTAWPLVGLLGVLTGAWGCHPGAQSPAVRRTAAAGTLLQPVLSPALSQQPEQLSTNGLRVALGLREEKAVEHCLERSALVINTNSMFPDILPQR